MEGRYLGGRPPYGYRLVDAGPPPNPGKAVDGKRLHQLEPDPLTGPVVRRIYAEYPAGAGIHAIAERLTRDGILCPSAAHRKRNPHRHGTVWSKGAVRIILTNPRYTGRQVWNKQLKAEILNDVALGHETKTRCNPADDWIYSTAQATFRGLLPEPGTPKASFRCTVELIGPMIFSRVQYGCVECSYSTLVSKDDLPRRRSPA